MLLGEVEHVPLMVVMALAKCAAYRTIPDSRVCCWGLFYMTPGKVSVDAAEKHFFNL